VAQAVIRSLESLEQLRVAIISFCEKNDWELYAIDSKIQTRLNALVTLETRFLRAVEAAKDNLRQAIRDLNSCRADSYVDENGNRHEPDCSSEQGEVYKCEQELAKAERNYSIFKSEVSKVKKSIDEHKNKQVRYRTIIRCEKEEAPNCLRQLINGAEDYISVLLSGSVFDVNGPGDNEPKGVPASQAAKVPAGMQELFFLKEFSFTNPEGAVFSFINRKEGSHIITLYSGNGSEYVCSELIIECKGTDRHGKILSISIPQSLQHEKAGKYLVHNMEINSRANDCKSIYGWANESNIQFYGALGYQSRNEIKGAGCEIYKLLDSIFFTLQQMAKNVFNELADTDYLEVIKLGMEEINPLNIISPVECNDENFWEQHGLNQVKYINLIESYEKCREELKKEKTLDEIRLQEESIASAYDIFHGAEAICLLRYNGYYQMYGKGRHWVAAAQLYYLRTGKIINLPAGIFEKKYQG